MQRLPALMFTILFFITACTKEPDKIGLDVQPPNDKINVIFTDTVEVVAYSEIMDSISTDEFSANILGSYMDLIFGKTTAGFYTQIRLSDNNVNFGSGAVLDSIVLHLQYSGSYGYSSSPLNIKVFEVAQDMYQDSTYYSNRKLPIHTKPFFNELVYPKPYDSIDQDSVKYPGVLSLRMHPQLGYNFIGKSGQTELSDNDYFLQYFKGLYITVDPVSAKGIMLYFNLESVASNLTLYYHNDEDTLSYIFVINDKCARFNNFDHNDYDDASTEFKQQVKYNDTLKGKELLYVQAMAGVRTKIRFKDIRNLAKGKHIIINKAELFMKATVDQPELTPPDRLALAKINEEGTNEFTPDQLAGDAYFGGYYDSNTKEYRFRITKYIQQLIDGKIEDYGLALMVSGNAVTSNRAVFTGTDPSDPSYQPQRFRIHISYTSLNN